jgi:zinc D-Ala-D-Ala carboxypeptidase|tara:strand:+ start:194 stop:562 length:369 start_codon:yes stop_codon:yes gene_type:complete
MRYFNYTEFDSPDELGSGQNMSPKILEMLDQAREKYDKPIKITSGYRTQAYNEDLKARGYKASKNSSHLKGLAVDIHCNNSKDRFELVDILLDVGFNRIGIANTFIHADIDEDKPTHLIWTY